MSIVSAFNAKSLVLSAVLGLLALALGGLASIEPSLTAILEEGDRLFQAGHRDEAAAAYRRARTRAGTARVDAVETRIHFLAGVDAAQRDDLAAARRLFETSLAEARRAGDRRREGRSLHACGNIAMRQNDVPRAQALYRAGLTIAAELHDRRLLTFSYRSLGDAACELGRNGEALGFYQRALALARQAGNPQQVEQILNALGSVYLEWADYAKALEVLTQAQRIGTDDPSELSYLFNNLGIAYGSQGSSELGMDYFRRALRLAESAGDNYARMRLLNNLGACYEAVGDYPRAEAHFRRALRLAEAMDDRAAMVGDWRSLGTVYENQKRLALARQAYGKSLDLAESTGERNLVSQALEVMARIELRADRSHEALDLADRAAAIAAETGSRETFWRVRTLAGESLRALGHTAAARTAFEDAIATLEQVRSHVAGGELGRHTFFEGRIEPYQQMIELAAEGGDAAAALAQAERARARALFEILQQGRLDPASRLSPAELATEARLRERLASLNAELFLARSRSLAPLAPKVQQDVEQRLHQARRELEAFKANLYASRTALRARRADFPAWTAAAAAALLSRGDTALIEYAVLANQTYVFTVTADGGGAPAVSLHRLPLGRDELSREVAAFRGSLAARDLDFRAAARRLHDRLLGPVPAGIRDRKRLCIVPDGPLWELPFQALQPDDSTVLLEQHALYYAPSLSFLSALAARGGGPGSRSATLLAVGDPELARLPEAEREVLSLAQLYGVGRSAVYTQGQASEERVKAEAGKYQVLHFATHALLDDRNPMYSSLVLSRARPGGEDDGLLEAWELLDLRLDADLVVLSACQTARGRLRAGEGMIGLTWAFAAAGSPATLASQWEVSSDSTSQLMVAFHRGWLAGLDKAEALRQAALSIRAQERYRHPFYWAAFVLVGEGD